MWVGPVINSNVNFSRTVIRSNRLIRNQLNTSKGHDEPAVQQVVNGSHIRNEKVRLLQGAFKDTLHVVIHHLHTRIRGPANMCTISQRVTYRVLTRVHHKRTSNTSAFLTVRRNTFRNVQVSRGHINIFSTPLTRRMTRVHKTPRTRNLHLIFLTPYTAFHLKHTFRQVNQLAVINKRGQLHVN